MNRRLGIRTGPAASVRSTLGGAPVVVPSRPQGGGWVRCPNCNVAVLPGNLARHQRRVHGSLGTFTAPKEPSAVRAPTAARTQQDRLMATCPICAAVMSAKRLKRHLAKVHASAAAAAKQPSHRGPITRSSSNPPAAASTASRSELHERTPCLRSSNDAPSGHSHAIRLSSLRIESKRGTRIMERTRCSACTSTYSFAFRYAKTNAGIVYLCSRCRDTALAQRTGSSDAWHKRVRL